MLTTLKRNISRHITNFAGWRTDQKIVVIESDDWGSIRMPSQAVYKKSLRAGYQVDRISYERFDSLASEDDLELLFELLMNHKDQHGNTAVITANVLTANPDFEKIKQADYQQYFYERISKTFANYPKHKNCLKLWQKGKDNGVFFPQSHGREHVNVSLFMKALQQGDEDAMFGFEHKMPGSISKKDPLKGNPFVESLRYTDEKDKLEKLSIMLEGLDLFEELMGYKSQSLIPPNYIWSPDFDKAIAAQKVRFYQGSRIMREPLFEGGFGLHNYNLGEENSFGQKYLVRNASFEPALFNVGPDPVGNCLKDVAAAFRMNKPAIICSHRINYVGFIDERNRDKNLKLLDELLSKIIRRWPEVEFLNSVQLGNLMVE